MRKIRDFSSIEEGLAFEKFQKDLELRERASNDIMIMTDPRDKRAQSQVKKVLDNLGIAFEEPVMDPKNMVFWVEVDNSELQALRSVNWVGSVSIQEEINH